MLDLSKLLGVYSPILVTNYLALDIPYIGRLLILLIFLWGIFSLLIRLLQGMLR